MKSMTHRPLASSGFPGMLSLSPPVPTTKMRTGWTASGATGPGCHSVAASANDPALARVGAWWVYEQRLPVVPAPQAQGDPARAAAAGARPALTP